MNRSRLLIGACCVAAALLLAGGGFAQGGEAEAHPLLGKPAPNFSLDLLDGKKLNLADHKGKDIVVLDFWATWCPPCRFAMPIIVGVTDAYKDKHVVFYGVNIKESPEAVKAFQKKTNLKFEVAFDKDGDVANDYRAEGIPQSVIIDKNGIVQAVHVGVLPDLKERLKKELDTLLEGKSLVKVEEKKKEKK